MGFFGVRLKRKSKKKGLVSIQPQIDKLDIAYKEGCKACPLNNVDLKHPKMKPTGSKEPIIYIAGESPGVVEDERGKQFVGASGQLLRGVLEAVFGGLSYIRFNNIIRCRTSDTNRNPTDLEIECCRKSIEQDIIKTKPEIVIGTGAVPLKWFLNTKAGIMLWRGRKIPLKLGSHSFWFYPILHPAFVLRNQNEYGTDSISKVFFKDIESILGCADEPKVQPVLEDGVVLYKEDNLKTIETELNKFASKGGDVGVDIETNALKPFNPASKILSIAIGTDNRIINFPVEYGSNNEYSKSVLELIRVFLLNSGRKIVQNLKFELLWFNKYFGQDVLYKTEWEDTQAQAYVIDERSGSGILGLDSLCLQYFGIRLKEYSHIDVNDLANCDLTKLLVYGGLDVKYTYKLFMKQQKILNDKHSIKANSVYNDLVITAKTLAVMEQKGLLVDVGKVNEISKKVNKEIQDINGEISGLDEVGRFESKYYEFNHRSNKDLRIMFEDILKLKPVKATKKGAFSVDKEALGLLVEQGVGLASILVRFRELDKLRSTYIDSMPKYLSNDTNILRPEFSHLSTATNRLCVAEGTYIDVVRDVSKEPTGRLIENVRKDDLVYSYNKTKLTIKKVLWAGKTGLKKVIRLHWLGGGQLTRGYLDVTPEHLIKLTDGTYKKACELTKKDNILALHRSITNSYDHVVMRIEHLNEKVGVYDIEVEDTHNFIANELCVHNSSSNPNIQNVPKRKNAYVRSIIIVPKNYWFVAIDYSQLEARILAELSGEINIVKTDIHKTWALEVIKAYPKVINVSSVEDLTDKKLKHFRSEIKNSLVFPWFYGAGKKSVGKTLNIPDSVVSRLWAKFWQSFSRVKCWQQRLQTFYDKNQYVEAPVGRRRHAPLDRNQIFNTLPQGIAAFDIVVCSMNRLSSLGYELDKKQYQAVLNIHDDLSFYVPDKTLDEDIEFICKEMVRLPDFIKTVDLQVEVSVGKNWYELEEIGKFSTKDFDYA